MLYTINILVSNNWLNDWSIDWLVDFWEIFLLSTCFVFWFQTVQVDIPSSEALHLTNGGLDGTYTAAQLHFHWGHDNKHGSEHTFRGQQFPLEVNYLKCISTYIWLIHVCWLFTDYSFEDVIYNTRMLSNTGMPINFYPNNVAHIFNWSFFKVGDPFSAYVRDSFWNDFCSFEFIL